MPLLVHGVLDSASGERVSREELADAAGSAVDLVVDGALVAVVSEIDTPEAVPSRANLMAHTRVLERLAGTATVAPMRFGVVVAGREELEEQLEHRREHFLDVIHRLEGHLELRLRGRYEQDEVVREVVAADPRAARLRGSGSFDARMELGERVVAGIEARREVDRDLVLRRLAAHVADVAVSDVADPLDAFAVSLLVHEDDVAEFDAAVESLGVELSPTVRLELVGPVPPFSFAGIGEA
jgi:hypothetical protein